MTEHLLAIMVAAPAVAALLLLGLPPERKLAIRAVSLAGAAVALVASLAAVWLYDGGVSGWQFAQTYPLVPSLGIAVRLAADGWSIALGLLTGLIIFAGVLASWTIEDRPKEFFVFLLVLVAGVFGVFVCQDLFVFFLLYEIAVLPMYLLIGIWGTSKAVASGGPFWFSWRIFDVGGRQYAAMKLTLMLLFGSALILVGILAIYEAAGGQTFDMQLLARATYSRSLQLWVFPLMWMGFGTLAGVFPFHTWSPDGHASAPTAVSMLHAGVLMKLGAFGVIRVGMMLLPEGAQAWAPVVGAVAVLNIVYGAVSAMAQKDLKYIVAYSSVSHMGVVMLGAATMTVNGWNGAVYQMVAHGVMTGLFFALVGLVYERTHTRQIEEMGGLARVMPGIAAFFTIGCLSSLGLPGTAGFVAELLVLIGAAQSAQAWWAVPAAIGAFITALYVLRASRTIFWGPGPVARFASLGDASRSEWGALWILGAAIIVLGFWPGSLLGQIDRTTTAHLARLVRLTVTP